MAIAKPSKDFQLAPGITSEQYRLWRDDTPPKRSEIARLVKRRFESRFIEPVTQADRVRGGFASVALCCFAMEALDAFRHGHAESDTATALRRLGKNNPEFAALKSHEHKFHQNIRNGLLHQAETRGGWRIHISGPIFNETAKIVGAQALMDAFVIALNRYASEIENSTDDSPVWVRLLAKMELVLASCDDEPNAV